MHHCSTCKRCAARHPLVTILLIAVLLVTWSTVPLQAAVMTNSKDLDNKLNPDVCPGLVHQIYHGHVVAPVPPDINGVWTSHRCEVRPGPEYILRKYEFLNDSEFIAYQFYYADSDCSNPIYTVVAIGTFDVIRPSWTTPGATEVDFIFPTQITVTPYTKTTASILAYDVNRTCPGHVTSPWQPLHTYNIYSYDIIELEGDREYDGIETDCTDAINFTLNEFQLLRVEERKHHSVLERALYLGDIHTDPTQRKYYRPRSYQEPMLQEGSAGCAVCHLLASTDSHYPPTLVPRHHLSNHPSLVGEWFSERCEARPSSHTLTRRLVFGTDNKTWEGHYYHYADALCREPMFTIIARGSYTPGAKSTVAAGAFHYDFLVTQILVTPEDDRILQQWNEAEMSGCSLAGSWEIGVEQDVGVTGDCAPRVGIYVAPIQYELLMVEKEHHKTRLFLGQPPSDGLPVSTPTNRPTSFQPPLVKCAHTTTNFKPPVSRRIHRYRHRSSANLSQSYPLILLILLVLAKSLVIK